MTSDNIEKIKLLISLKINKTSFSVLCTLYCIYFTIVNLSKQLLILH